MSNEPQDEFDDAATQRDERFKLGRLMSYSEAVESDPQLAAKYMKMMEKLLKNPNDYDLIISWGAAPMREMGDAAKKLFDVQKKYDTVVNSQKTAMDKFKDNISLNGLQKLKSVLSKGVNKGAEAVVGTVGVMGKTKRWVTGIFSNKPKEDEKSEEEQRREEIQPIITTMHQEFEQMCLDMHGLSTAIVKVQKDAEELLKARSKCYKELGLYLAAGEEMLRRYNEELIPELQEEYDENGDEEIVQEISEMRDSARHFDNQLTQLFETRKRGVILAQQVYDIIRDLKDMRMKVRNTVEKTQHELMAMLAGAGLQVSALKSAETLSDWDTMGDDWFKQMTEMNLATREMVRKTLNRGTVDAKVTEAALERMIEAYRVQAQEDAERLQRNLEARQGAQADIARLLDAANTVKRSERTLDAANDAEGVRTDFQEASDKGASAEKPAAPANDDEPVSEEAQPAAEAPAAAKKAATGTARRKPARKPNS